MSAIDKKVPDAISSALGVIDDEFDKQVDVVMQTFEKFCSQVLEFDPGDIEVAQLHELVIKYRKNHPVANIP